MFKNRVDDLEIGFLYTDARRIINVCTFYIEKLLKFVFLDDQVYNPKELINEKRYLTMS